MFVFETNYGSFTVELDFANAPISSKNFQNYADSGFYDGTIFHRVINDFMIQGGGFEPGLTQKSTEESIENEANNGLSNELGTLAMARTADPHSASSQFFINVSDNFFLDHKDPCSQGWGYAVFGKVVEGMENVDKIKKGDSNNNGSVKDPDKIISFKSL